MRSQIHAGFCGQSGVQSHSAGGHYPILSYQFGDHALVAEFQGVRRVRTNWAEHTADLARLKLAEQLADRYHAGRPDGFTHWLNDTPTDRGYVVGLYGRESQFPATGPTWGAVFADIVDKLEFLDHPYWRGADVGVGFWCHDGRLFVDVVLWILQRADAIRAGRDGKQISVWDLAGGCDILIDSAE